MEIPQVLIAVGIPVAKGVAGWLNKALEDNVIEMYEWKKGLATLLRASSIGLIAYYSIPIFGLDIEVVTASAIGTFVDWLFDRFKKSSDNV